ncbi:putative oligopeptide transporter [Erysiphe neolycopersici]|uniref:Putative oligopeptide transporter n=1 Tax=Erysiphe neolycopersici TaxID=212602 RepID=A0A420HFV1_9PEZI|nr:putative oligopeptide transporter [Erysiphe neolycopersici]
MASSLQRANSQYMPLPHKLDFPHEEMSEEDNRVELSQEFMGSHTQESKSFTLRGILVGLMVGSITCFSNMYFGLQSGWISPMSMPSALMGFVFFKSISKHLDLPFSPVENVLIQSVSGGMGTMPLGCGLVGIMPALNFMLTPEEQGPIILSHWKLILWSLGLCFFGVIFAVPLRKQVIIREKLKFPSGTATAIMIETLHKRNIVTETRIVQGPVVRHGSESQTNIGGNFDPIINAQGNWKAKIRVLGIAFTISGVYTVITYFLPILRNLPIFGSTLASTWLWTLNASPAYVGQGIIMGHTTTIHMLLGAAVGWGILSPLAKYRGWAPGPVDDWESGSKGWIMWISLAIMFADSIISLGYIGLSPVARYIYSYLLKLYNLVNKSGWRGLLGTKIRCHNTEGYAPVMGREDHVSSEEFTLTDQEPNEPDVLLEHCIKNRTVCISGILSIAFCVLSIYITFGPLIPIYATVSAILMALLLSIMGVRALGETDLNPVSGISKLAQLLFAIFIPASNKNSILINLVAGAISEAGALQAGDLLQDLKTGHLLGAAPDAQFWGQIIGSAVGAIVSSLIYKLYTNVYSIPGKLFQVPTGYVWISTARLVTGHGLPEMAWAWCLSSAVLFTGLTLLRIVGVGKKWHSLVPSGIAVAVGMYNPPSFTLARVFGGTLSWYWNVHKLKDESVLIILASGLILGEGVLSILNLMLASVKVPHL